MKDILQEILDWSEAWAPLIPLLVFWIKKPREAWIRPLVIYLVIAFLLNLIATIIWKRMHMGLEGWMQQNLGVFYNADGSLNNTIFYNLHSISRFLLFAWFFHYMGKQFRKINKVLPPLVILLGLIYFIFYDDIRDFSSVLFSTEAALLLFYGLFYYLILLRDEQSHIKRQPSFWIVTGLSIYVVINFPIFLFYSVLEEQADKFAVDIWDLHNISYIVFCLLIAKSFYAAKH